jgi:hypothetical protein
MVQVSRRTGLTGSALVHLLSRLTDLEHREFHGDFADRLSQWVGWTDAISLSAALNGSPSAVAGARGRASDEEAECLRVRTALANAITDRRAAPGERGEPAADFSSHRSRYLARQQAMEAGIGPLRDRLRSTLSARSLAMARLAAVDTVMEQALGAQERSLLATVPTLLETRFKRLQAQAAQADSGTTDAPHDHGEVPPDPWQDVFRRDMQEVLLAELDFRMQPVEGLLAALRMRPPDCQ